MVIHTAQGAETYQSLGSFFADPSSGVSSHVGIDDTPGTVGEYVRPDYKAWTAANANPVAIQAELCAWAEWTPEEWARWPELHMRLAVNAQPRQDAYCREMIHAPAATLSELAAIHDLSAGDLIATGTPAGCAASAPGKLAMFVLRHFVSDASKWQLFIRKGRDNPAYLRPGDRLSLSIRTDDGAIDLGEQTTVITTD